MVLEEALGSEPENSPSVSGGGGGGWDDASNGGVDTGSESGGTDSIDTSQMAQPWPIARLLRSEQAAINLSKALSTEVSKVVGRPLTSSESAAVTSSIFTGTAGAANAQALTMGLALLQCYRKRATFRFPFFDPTQLAKNRGHIFNHDVFPPFSPAQLRGQPARIAWHASRAVTYAAVGSLLVPSIFLTRFLSSAAMNQDPRTKQLTHEVSVAAQAKMQERAQKVEAARAGRQTGGSREADAHTRPRDAWGSLRGRRTSDAVADDMSPTAGSEDTSFTDSMADGYTDSAAQARPSLDTPFGGRQSDGEQQYGSLRGEERYGQQRDDQRTSRRPGNDASPFDGYSGSQSEGSASSESSGSAWDRLRQKSQAGRSGGEESSFASDGRSGRGSGGGRDGSGSGW